MAFPLPRELNPIEAIRKELKLIEKMKHVHPQFDRDLNRWLVAYVWDDGSALNDPYFSRARPKQRKSKPYPGVECPHGFDACPKCDAYPARWLLAGFARKPRRWSVRSLRKIRRKLKVPKRATMHVTELWRGIGGIPTQPPARRLFTTAPVAVAKRSLEMSDLGPKRERKFQRSPERTQAFGKKVKYIAFGKIADSKAPRPTYLGPLMAMRSADARKEAKAMFKMYRHVVVFDLALLPSRWRRKIRSGHYRPGAMLDARITHELEAVSPAVALAVSLKRS